MYVKKQRAIPTICTRAFHNNNYVKKDWLKHIEKHKKSVTQGFFYAQHSPKYFGKSS